MYPETDIPPLEVTEDMHRDAEELTPEPVEVKMRRLVEEYGLSRELAEQVIGDVHLDLIERLIREYGDRVPPKTIASIFVVTLRGLRGEGVDVEAVRDEHLEEVVRMLAEGAIAKEAVEEMCTLATLECFSFPASPHLAAEREGRILEPERLIGGLERFRNSFDILLLEGVGGLMVPLNRRLLLIDLIRGLGMATLLVAKSWLGTINHTLLSLEALERRQIPVKAVMLNSGGGLEEVPDAYLHPDIISDNRRIIEEFGARPVLGPVPRQPRIAEALSSIKDQADGLLGL
jgi:dethiobiotin synthase